MIEAGTTQLGELQERLRPYIARRLGRAEDVDDVLQEVLVRIHSGIGSLRDEQLVGPWVYRIATNAVVDHLRTRARSRVEVPGVDAEARSAAPPPSAEDETSVAEELAGYVGAFVDALPEPYRETLRLTELAGLTQKLAAERLGIGLSAIKARVRRGRALLRQALEDCCALELDARGQLLECSPRSDGVVPRGCCN